MPVQVSDIGAAIMEVSDQAIKTIGHIPCSAVIEVGVVYVINVGCYGRVVGVAGVVADIENVTMAGKDQDFAGIFIVGDEDSASVGGRSIRHAIVVPAVAREPSEDAEFVFRWTVEDLVVAGVVCEVVEPGQYTPRRSAGTICRKPASSSTPAQPEFFGRQDNWRCPRRPF